MCQYTRSMSSVRGTHSKKSTAGLQSVGTTELTQNAKVRIPRTVHLDIEARGTIERLVRRKGIPFRLPHLVGLAIFVLQCTNVLGVEVKPSQRVFVKQGGSTLWRGQVVLTEKMMENPFWRYEDTKGLCVVDMETFTRSGAFAATQPQNYVKHKKENLVILEPGLEVKYRTYGGGPCGEGILLKDLGCDEKKWSVTDDGVEKVVHYDNIWPAWSNTPWKHCMSTARRLMCNSRLADLLARCERQKAKMIE